jgi:bla regulator protein blaR1
MLADRLKLKAHLVAKQEPIYTLTVGKKGPRFKQSVPGETHPGSFPAPGGGSMSMQIKDGLVNYHYFDMTIDELISWAFKSADRPVRDRTDLAGKYDFTVTQPQPPGAGTPEVKPVEMPLVEKANQLGLKLEPAEGKVEFLVIDHIERPSPN